MARYGVGGWGTVKPPLGTAINWGHPLTQGVAASYLFCEGLTVPSLTGVGGIFCATGAVAPDGTRVAGSGGAGIRLVSAQTQWRASTAPTLPSQWASQATMPRYTLAVLYTPLGVGNGPASLFSVISSTNSNQNSICIRADTGADFIGYKNGSSSFGAGFNVGLSATYGRTSMLALTYDQVANVATLYFRGRVAGTGTTTTWAASSPGHAIGDINSPRTINGVIHAAHSWSRLLTPQEVAWLSTEPYAMFVSPGMGSGV